MTDGITLGHATATPTELTSRVCYGASGSPGYVQKATGLASWSRRMRMTRDDRSRSGASGTVTYGLDGDGLYRASNIACSSSRTATFWLRVCGDEIEEIDEEGVDDMLRTLFPDEASTRDRQETKRRDREAAAAEARAMRLHATRQAFDKTPAVALDGLTLELRDPTTEEGETFGIRAQVLAYGDRGVRALGLTLMPGASTCDLPAETHHIRVRCGRLEDAETNERWYLVNGQVLIESDEEEVLAKRSERQKALAANVTEKVLPELQGSPRQVAWANDLRLAFAADNPTSPKLRQVKRAK